MTTIDPAVGLRFEVVVDGERLGAFTSCEGLAAEYEIYEHEEGGNNGYVHRVPGRLRYTSVKLTRPLDANSASLATWFAGFQRSVTRCTASITALGGNRDEVIARWDLVGVYPAKWSGPTFSSDGSNVAKETLELAHNGFLA